MLTLRHRFRSIPAWLAGLAMLFGALAPSVSHVLAQAAGTRSVWVEVCSTLGVRQVAVAVDIDIDVGIGVDTRAGTAPERNGAAAALEHCPFCLTYAGSFALPAATPAALPVPAGIAVVPDFSFVPRPAFRPVAAPPRGPPALA